MAHKFSDFRITDIDHYEQDAFLEFDGKRLYFQFSREPDIGEALMFLLGEQSIEVTSRG